ncbi:TolB family protein [Flagellimonas olearia]|uniref:TolB family protein n=1 Tax=Flagellimonas olearia TaxID=552546 RepID=UPI0014787CFC|nr:PD40 domain-containing protein [Allomuricauda olearia]
MDFNALFSPDGKTFYFSRSVKKKYLIMETSWNGGSWSEPKISSLFDTIYSNTDPFFDQDGSLYFISNRPRTTNDTIDDYDIYKMENGKSGLRPARPIVEINSDSIEYYVSVAKNGNIYFASYINGNLDLYKSEKVGATYEKPVFLNALNSEFEEHDPYIAPDESYIIFTSTRKGGFGEADLYFSKNNDGHWTAPINLGKDINTATYDYCPYITPDSKFFFYSSELDVKWMSTDFLKKYR